MSAGGPSSCLRPPVYRAWVFWISGLGLGSQCQTIWVEDIPQFPHAPHGGSTSKHQGRTWLHWLLTLPRGKVRSRDGHDWSKITPGVDEKGAKARTLSSLSGLTPDLFSFPISAHLHQPSPLMAHLGLQGRAHKKEQHTGSGCLTLAKRILLARAFSPPPSLSTHMPRNGLTGHRDPPHATPGPDILNGPSCLRSQWVEGRLGASAHSGSKANILCDLKSLNFRFPPSDHVRNTTDLEGRGHRPPYSLGEVS